MLVFEDECQFDEITNMLVYETEKYISDYFAKFSDTLSTEKVNDIVEKEGFNPNVVYESFESFNNFHSLRAKLKQQEDEWLENENAEGESPILYPLSERCLPIANIEGEYQIGMNIYRVEKDGDVYVVGEGDCLTLALIREDKLNENIINSNLRKTRKTALLQCKAYVRLEDSYISGDHKMEMILDVDWDGYGSAAKAKVLSYKKKKKLIGGGTKWGREWTAMAAQVYLQDYNINCEAQKEYNSGIKERKNAYYVSAHVYGPGAGFRVKADGTFWGRYWTEDIGWRGLKYTE